MSEKTAPAQPEKQKETLRLILDFFHRTVIHHAMWFTEVQHHLGIEKAYEALNSAWEKSYSIQMKRIAKVLEFELDDSLPVPLLHLPNEKLEALRDALAVNWLANDGVWFQAVEFTSGMKEAKQCNDSCWAQFSPFEAKSIKRMLNLPDMSGLEGLKTALKYRLYAHVNKQSIVQESEKSFVFQMNECRVQIARKRKGLSDYPCKSGGLVEYTTFAKSIEKRIKTEVISCPPDSHPETYYCAWRFFMEE